MPEDKKTKKKQLQVKLDEVILSDLLDDAAPVESKTGFENVELSKLQKGTQQQHQEWK